MITFDYGRQQEPSRVERKLIASWHVVLLSELQQVYKGAVPSGVLEGGLGEAGPRKVLFDFTYSKGNFGPLFLKSQFNCQKFTCKFSL
jgi:hypothetical protein